MRVLVLGGTSFVGRHIAEAVIAAGHDVVFFNRGITDPSLFPEQTHVRGDRDADVSALGEIEADVAIDTSGYTPDAVRASAVALASRVRRYVFTSSIDVYDLSAEHVDEASPTRELAVGAQTNARDPELYGAHKARCERDLLAVFGSDRTTIVRAGLMVGPHDATDRFTYWPVRVARGGEILAPRSPQMFVQVIDVRDVATWIVRAIERDVSGTYNLVGTPGTLRMGDVLEACRRAVTSEGRFTWIPDDFLLERGVEPWVEMPLWAPTLPELRALCNVRNDAARANGLQLRPLAETIRATLDEARRRPASRTLRGGLAPERERSILDAYRARLGLGA